MIEKIREVRLVLASASPRRKELMRQIGMEPEIIPSRVEEVVTGSDPECIVRELSEQKAAEVAGRLADEAAGQAAAAQGGSAECGSALAGGKRGRPVLVIGSDTVVSIDGQILGKPEDRQAAYDMLERLQGKSHQVYTGVTLMLGGRTRTFSVGTKVEVYPMTAREIEDYLDCGESMDKAGAYGIQGRFAAHIKGIQGSYTNVVGLPVGRLYQEIKQFLEEQE